MTVIRSSLIIAAAAAQVKLNQGEVLTPAEQAAISEWRDSRPWLYKPVEKGRPHASDSDHPPALTGNPGLSGNVH